MARCRDIAVDLKHRIAAGEFSPGDRLPTISDLMAHYGVCPASTPSGKRSNCSSPTD